ncbi:MAG: right-handed parallel beta-helix repeat-containing protein [Nitrospirae bacterium]|nr:right-handed parallel beta-helix repeat-containing protein [Nitrospirota bacterium]
MFRKINPSLFLSGLVLAVILAIPSGSYAGGPATRVTAEKITADTTWKGSVVVENTVSVIKGATLVIKPGTVVRFRKNTGLEVQGVLKAEGVKGSQVTLTSDEKKPGRADWYGVNLGEAGEGTVLKHCVMEYAGVLSIAACSPLIQDCDFRHCNQGIVMARKSSPDVRGNRINDMKDGGISCEMGSAPAITGNTIDGCGPAGINVGKDSQPVIKGNTITICGVGIGLMQPIPPVEDNVLKKNNIGISLSSVGGGLVIRGNRFQDNETGIACQQFSSPLIEGNTISGNKEGIVCFRASSPIIRKNEIAGNTKGIICIQLCNPRIIQNDIRGNKEGIYLDLSSYATINGNNIHENEMHVDLGNMSADWEHRVNKKPVRGSQAQTVGMSNAGREAQVQPGDGSEVMDSVDATGNWWGAKTTEEMEKKGPDADIAGLRDYHDQPTRTYEGYEGVYVQDKVRYEGWKKTRIKDAGL